MRVFVAGASGILGRVTTRHLLDAGHEVVGLVRSREKQVIVASLGAEPVLGDLLERPRLEELVTASGANAVAHLATAIPTKVRLRPADFVPNDRLRIEGTRNLIAAAVTAGAGAYVQQSIAFVYGNRGCAWLDETAPPDPDAVSASAVESERLVLEAYEGGLPAVILRGGSFYHPEAWSTRLTLSRLRQRKLPIIGKGAAYWHLVHVEDMARAVMLALERAGLAGGQIYNVTDDDPATSAEILRHVALLLEAKPPRRIPRLLARLAIGAYGVQFLTRSARYHNDKLKRDLGWEPTFPSYKDGYGDMIAHAHGL